MVQVALVTRLSAMLEHCPKEELVKALTSAGIKPLNIFASATDAVCTHVHVSLRPRYHSASAPTSLTTVLKRTNSSLSTPGLTFLADQGPTACRPRGGP
jgi:hypothetical protein